MIHNLLRLTLAHNVPVSLRAVPEKHNLLMRLWLNGFHRPLENLRRCAFNNNNSIVALEHLQDFIYYAYTFYSCLFEEENLSFYRSSCVESLGDLARYRMAVSELGTTKTSRSTSLTRSAVSQVPDTSDDVAMSIGADNTKASQISDDLVLPKGNTPSVGVVATRVNENHILRSTTLLIKYTLWLILWATSTPRQRLSLSFSTSAAEPPRPPPLLIATSAPLH